MPAATVQGLDQYGNIACNFSSCDDIPDAEGCYYTENYSAFHADFNAANCVEYGGTPCEGSGGGNTGGNSGSEGCIDASATNYDASASTQSLDQYGNLTCIYTSCNDIPEPGCIYSDGFGVFNPEFDGTGVLGFTEGPLVMNLEVEIRVETRVTIQTLKDVLTQMQTTTMQQQPYKV